MQNTPTTPDVEAQIGAYKRYLRDIEGAYLFGISRTTFRKLVRQGLFPRPIKLGHCARWERDGNGTWEGSDVLDAALRESVPNIRLLSELYLQAEQVEQAESNVDEIIF